MQVAASFGGDIVVASLIKVGVYPCSVINRQVQVQADVAQVNLLLRNSDCCGVLEVDELHKAVKLLVRLYRCVGHHICYVAPALHDNVAIELHVAQAAANHGTHVHEQSSVEHGSPATRRVYQFVVHGAHAQVECRVKQPAEIHIAVYLERVVAHCIYAEILELQPVVDYRCRCVRHVEACAKGKGINVHRLKLYMSVGVQVVEHALGTHVAAYEPLQGNSALLQECL